MSIRDADVLDLGSEFNIDLSLNGERFNQHNLARLRAVKLAIIDQVAPCIGGSYDNNKYYDIHSEEMSIEDLLATISGHVKEALAPSIPSLKHSIGG